MWDNKPKRTAKTCPKCWATTDRPHNPDTCINYLRALATRANARAQEAEKKCAEWERIADLVVAFRFEAGVVGQPEIVQEDEGEIDDTAA